MHRGSPFFGVFRRDDYEPSTQADPLMPPGQARNGNAPFRPDGFSLSKLVGVPMTAPIVLRFSLHGHRRSVSRRLIRIGHGEDRQEAV